MNSRDYKIIGVVLFIVLSLCIGIILKYQGGTLYDLSTNIVAEALGIFITLYVIDKLIKRGEWKRQFFFDKQTRFNYIYEIIYLIDSIIDCLNPHTDYIKQENRSLLIDQTKLQLKMKLCNKPITETFGAKHIIGNYQQVLQQSGQILNDLEIYIKRNDIDIDELRKQRLKLLRSGMDILKMNG